MLSHNEQHAPAPDQAQCVLKLKAGRNDLLVKACFIDHGREVYFKSTPPTEAVPQLFEDVSDKMGLGISGAGGSAKGDALLIADVNGDGRPDVLFCAGSGILLLNTPSGFVEAKNSGLSFKTGKITPIFGDFFGDHRAHLLVPQPVGLRLFRNDGKGHFTDISANTGDLGKLKCDASSAAIGDFSGHHRADILVGCIRGPNHLLRNNGDGTFTDISEEVGLDQRVFNTRATAVLDFNRDGAPDVVFVNEGQDSQLLLGKMRLPATSGAQQPAGDSGADRTVAAAFMQPGSTGGPHAQSVLSIAGVVALLGMLWLVFPKKFRGARHAAVIAVLFLLPADSFADWPMSRGNVAHTGTDDNLPGPRNPKVRWVYKAHEHFIASPVPADRALYVSGLGDFNSSAFHALALERRFARSHALVGFAELHSHSDRRGPGGFQWACCLRRWNAPDRWRDALLLRR